MQRCVALALVLILGPVCAAPASASLPGLEDIPAVVAEVDGQAIYAPDLIRELAWSAAPRALDNLVRRKLIEQAAAAENITVTDSEIETQLARDCQELKSEMTGMPWDKDHFPLAELIQARFRMTLDEYKTAVVRQKLLIRRCLLRDVRLEEGELRRFFTQLPELFQTPVTYHASHILLSPYDPRELYRSLRLRSEAAQAEALRKEHQRLEGQHIQFIEQLPADAHDVTPDRPRGVDRTGPAPVEPRDDTQGPEWARVRALAEKILSGLRAGDLTWDQAVRKYTQDPLDHPAPDAQTGRKVTEREKLNLAPGDVGWFHRGGPLVREFYEGAQALAPGEIGGPVRTEFGYHLIKMLEVKTPAPVAFEPCRERVERAYVEALLRNKSDQWIDGLVAKAVLQNTGVSLWPPRPALPELSLAPAPPPAAEAADPVAGTVNGAPLRRAEVWRELLRMDGDEALDRLIQRELVLGPLKSLGVNRLEWEGAHPAWRDPHPPPARAISIRADALEIELNTERLRHDREAPALSFGEFLYQRYGQTEREFKRSVEAALILRTAVHQKVKVDDATLQLQFALAREQYDDPAWYEISQILIVPTGGMENADQSAHLQARMIADQVYRACVQAPDHFAALVDEFSMDRAALKARQGRLGPCVPGGGNPDIPDGALFYRELERQKLAPGQVSPPVRSSRGYHILRVDARHPARPVQFREARARVEHDYLAEQGRMYAETWLRALLTQSKIKRYLFNPATGAPSPDQMPPDSFPVPKD